MHSRQFGATVWHLDCLWAAQGSNSNSFEGCIYPPSPLQSPKIHNSLHSRQFWQSGLAIRLPIGCIQGSNPTSKSLRVVCPLKSTTHLIKKIHNSSFQTFKKAYNHCSPLHHASHLYMPHHSPPCHLPIAQSLTSDPLTPLMHSRMNSLLPHAFENELALRHGRPNLSYYT